MIVISDTVIIGTIIGLDERAWEASLLTVDIPSEKTVQSPHLKKVLFCRGTYLLSMIRFIVIDVVWNAPSATKYVFTPSSDGVDRTTTMRTTQLTICERNVFVSLPIELSIDTIRLFMHIGIIIIAANLRYSPLA